MGFPRRMPLVAMLVATALPLAASAAPVRSDQPTDDPYELALSWTLAAVTAPVDAMVDAPPMPVSDAAPRAALPGLQAAVPAGGVPDPGAYALMGLGLLAAGLAGRLLAARQRGFSKKT